MNLTIKSNLKDYKVFFEGSLDFINRLIQIQNSVFIIDKNVYELYKSFFADIKLENLLIFDAIEENKTYLYVQNIYDFCIKQSAKRNLTLISIGGGITQDITGFAASTLYRGINWIFIPTTFLAMTDSCVGSKTSLNYGKHKNLIGTFYPPTEIYINPDFLNTLTELDFFSGIGETIKFQLMNLENIKSFEKIKNIIDDAVNKPESRLDLIHSNLAIKLSYMEGDEFDLGRRNLLNYGHCFGHGLETSSDYYIPHGIAINLGMIYANMLSVLRGLVNLESSNFVNDTILLPNVKLRLRKQDFNSEVLLASMKNDKKKIGQFLTVIIPDTDFNMIKVSDVTDDEFQKTFETFVEYLSNKGAFDESN